MADREKRVSPTAPVEVWEVGDWRAVGGSRYCKSEKEALDLAREIHSFSGAVPGIVKRTIAVPTNFTEAAIALLNRDVVEEHRTGLLVASWLYKTGETNE